MNCRLTVSIGKMKGVSKMLFKELLSDVRSYLPVRKQTESSKQELKEHIVRLSDEVKRLFPEYNVKGHAIQGLWADVPWIGIHDKRINSNPQTGIYVTILFKVDGSGFAFSIQHGTEHLNLREIPNEVRKVQKTIDKIPGFSKKPLVLRPDDEKLGVFNNSSRPAKYEIANILGRQYDFDKMPDDIHNDLKELVYSYYNLAQKIIVADMDEEMEYQNQPEEIYQENDYPPPDRRSEKAAKKIGSPCPQRSPVEGSKALAKASYCCEVDKTHETFTLENGKKFVEKHHLIPMEKYFDFDKSVDYYGNIFALCPNCHKKIHYACMREKKEMIEALFQKRKKMLEEIYGIKLEKLLSLYNISPK